MVLNTSRKASYIRSEYFLVPKSFSSRHETKADALDLTFDPEGEIIGQMLGFMIPSEHIYPIGPGNFKRKEP